MAVALVGGICAPLGTLSSVFSAVPVGVGVTLSFVFIIQCILWNSVWILTKYSWKYNLDITKNWLDFGDLDLIFKVTVWCGSCWHRCCRLLDTFMSTQYLVNQWLDPYQIFMGILLGRKELIRFGNLDLIFKVKVVEKLCSKIGKFDGGEGCVCGGGTSVFSGNTVPSFYCS